MSWYSEADYDAIPANNRSLVVSLANLARHYDIEEYSPETLYATLYRDGSPFPLHIDSAVLKENRENESSWPTDDGSIVKFRRYDNGTEFDHYCLVIDSRQMAIVDSMDGLIKHAGTYGQVYGWVSYEKQILIEKKTRYGAGDFYTWKKGDSLVDIAREMGVSYETLIKFNDFESYAELETGTPVLYPFTPASTARPIKVEVHKPELFKHVSKPGGTKKWMFGNMKRFEDAIPAGFYPERTNLRIAATVTVPVVDGDDKEAEAAYFVEFPALGDYETSGILRYTHGFAWSDLEDGHVETVLKRAEPAPEPVYTVTDIEENEETDTDKQIVLAPPTTSYADEILASYQKLPEPIDMIVNLPHDMRELIDAQTGKPYIYIKDFSGKKQDNFIRQYDGVTIGATFTSAAEIYGQREEDMVNKVFYGIPMNVLESESDVLHTGAVDPQTRAEAGMYLTWSERWVWIPVNKFLSKHLPGYIQKINKKDKS